MPTLTIDVTAAQAQRIAAAYGELLTPPGAPVAPATLAQVTKALKKELIHVVLRYEHQQAIKAVVVDPMDIP